MHVPPGFTSISSASRSARLRSSCPLCRPTMKMNPLAYFSIASFVLWGIIFLATYYQPKHIRATVDSAAVSNLTVAQNGTTLSYNLTVLITLYNPSVRVNIYYDSLGAILCLGNGAVLGLANHVWVAETYQLQKSKDAMVVKFYPSGVVITDDMAAELHRDINDNGEVSFEVVIRAWVRYKSGVIKTPEQPLIRCLLNIPVKAEGRHGGVDGVLAPGGRCRVKY